MLAVTTYTPEAGVSQVVNLPLQSGWTEVINDTNYLLVLTFNTGTIYQVPGMAQLYPTPEGGGTLSLLPPFTSVGAYLNADGGLSNNVVVNQYLEAEVVGKYYPYFMHRPSTTSNPLFPLTSTDTVASTSSSFSVTVNPLFVNTYLYLFGWDLSIDQESTSHKYTFTINGLGTPANTGVFTQYIPTYYVRSSTSAAVNLSWRYPFGLRALFQSSGITINAPGVSGGAATASLTMYCNEL